MTVSLAGISALRWTMRIYRDAAFSDAGRSSMLTIQLELVSGGGRRHVEHQACEVKYRFDVMVFIVLALSTKRITLLPGLNRKF